jgi:hypothetical protein
MPLSRDQGSVGSHRFSVAAVRGTRHVYSAVGSPSSLAQEDGEARRDEGGDFAPVNPIRGYFRLWSCPHSGRDCCGSLRDLNTVNDHSGDQYNRVQALTRR